MNGIIMAEYIEYLELECLDEKYNYYQIKKG
jgi:hypothetical protein